MRILKISPKIYISGAEEVNMREALQERRITAILNVAWEVNDFIFQPQEYKMVKVGLWDGKGNRPEMKALAVMALRCLLQAGHTVLVHCLHGGSRSPYIVFRYLSETENRTMDAIYLEFRAQYPDITISPLNYD